MRRFAWRWWWWWCVGWLACTREFRGCLGVRSSVEMLGPTGGLTALEDEEIIRALSRNRTDDGGDGGGGDGATNLTFVELIGSIANRTIESAAGQRGARRDEESVGNPRYHTFVGQGEGEEEEEEEEEEKDRVERATRRLLEFVPAFDPARGPVSPECSRHAEIFRRELSRFTLWALKMYDATAKIPSGLLSGNVNQFGDFDECVAVEGSDDIRGQYCLAFLQLELEGSRADLQHVHRLLHAHYAFRSNVTDPGHRVPRFSTINWAVCAPASCSFRDVETSLRRALDRHTRRTGLRISVRVDPEMCQAKRREPVPTETLLVGLFFLAVTALSLVAAYYEHNEIPASELLLAFSLKRNFKKLTSLERPDGDIATLHGVRAFNAFMLILAHKSMAIFFNPYVNRTGMAERLGQPWSVIGRAASLYTDPFIMLSGLLTSYSFLGRLRRHGRLDVRNEYLSRLLRLVPTLGALILFCTYVMPYIGSGPQWNLVVTHHAEICKQTWWRNFLFVHNYFGFENMCLTHTHHLGIDMQLFALSPLMILTLHNWPKIGAVLLAGLALLSTALRYYVTHARRLNNYVFFGTSIRQLFDTANLSYILPSHRLTVYVIGVFVGYALRSLPRDFRLNGTITRLGWTVCTVMFLGAFLGPARMGSLDYVYEPVHGATYNAFAPIGWCALFAWLAVLHHTGNTDGWLARLLSWRGFLVTTRLSYAIYLTQFPVFFYNVGQTRSAEHYEFLRMHININEILWILLTSLVLTLLFDAPFQNIKNHLLGKSTAAAGKSRKSD